MQFGVVRGLDESKERRIRFTGVQISHYNGQIFVGNWVAQCNVYRRRSLMPNYFVCLVTICHCYIAKDSCEAVRCANRLIIYVK